MKNSLLSRLSNVALLLIGAKAIDIHLDQHQASSQSHKASEQLTAEGLIEALSSTEVDLDLFAGLADEEDDDGDSSPEVKTIKFLAAEGPALKKKAKGTDNTKRIHGKDKFGQYKNQANFVKMRNKINAAESAH